MFIFAFANGTLEAVANPLVATLFPNNRTHFLNILHARWPAGLILGGVLAWVLDDKMQLDWKLQLSLYLIPALMAAIYLLPFICFRSIGGCKAVHLAGTSAEAAKPS